jgi:dihydroorotase
VIKSEVDQTIESEDLHISPGWIDIGAMCWDPGHEYREDRFSLKAAAANGGYTKVFIWPNTDPIIDNKAQYQYYSSDNKNNEVELFPICSITKGSEGKELAELIDLQRSGALLFSDGLCFNGPIKELRKAMEYTKSINAQILFCPSPFDINPDGQIHDSDVSISLGLPGLPTASEVMSIQKAVAIAEYTGTSVVLHNVSTKSGLSSSKSSAVASLGVSYLSLCANVKSCYDFDTNYKTIPPLRNEDDRSELVKAVKTNDINYISSNHYPLDNDIKDMEFGLAEFGASGIETVFSGLITHTDLLVEQIVEKLTYGPANTVGLELSQVEKGNKAELTVFDPNISWTYDKSTSKSKSRNNPYFKQEMKGKVLGIVF